MGIRREVNEHKGAIALTLLFILGLMAQASHSKTIDTFTPENVIEIISQTGIEANFNYSFKELNKTHWNASFCITNPLTVISPTSYNLTALTSNIEFEQGVSKVRFDSRTRCGWFYIIFPKGFMVGEQAKFGDSSTVIDTTVSIPFYPNQRAVCRDGSNNIHTAWLYNASSIKYANSTNNGATWTSTFINTSAGVQKGQPSISCNGNNITIAYEDVTANSVYVYISTNKGGSFILKTPATGAVYGTAGDVVVERRGARIYLVWAEKLSLGGDLKFMSSTNGGTSWSAVTDVVTGSYHAGFTDITFSKPSLAVSGTGTGADKLYISFLCNCILNTEYMYSVSMVNSSTAGTTFSGEIVVYDSTSSVQSASINYNATPEQVFVAVGTLANATLFNSSGTFATWTKNTVDMSSNTAANPSVAINNDTQVCVFWQQQNGTFNGDDIVYRGYNGTAWDSTVYNVTNNALKNQYPNTRVDYNPNGIDAVWVNGTGAIMNITYSLQNCSYTAAAPPAGGQPPALDIGDPLYCSVSPIVGVGISPVVLCMPKSNVTGQPLTGLTINCQTQLATGAYTGGTQSSSAMTEQTNGLYNYTIKNTSLSANTLYTVNCTTAITGVNNNFGAVFYVMPDFATNITSVNTSVNNLGINISDLNTTLIALGVNTSNIYDVLIALGINSSTINETCNLGFANATENFTNIENLINTLNDASAQDIWEYVLRDANCTNCTGEGSNITYNNSYYSTLTLTHPELRNISKEIVKYFNESPPETAPSYSLYILGALILLLLMTGYILASRRR